MSVMLKLNSTKKHSGFTIVELLIVIVVIGVLAAISVVAYNGISQNARVSSAKALAKQVSTKVELAYTESGTYPSDLSSLGFSNSGNTTYQYSTSANSWCTTVSVGSASYYVSNTATSPVSGGCPGHGQGGVDAITNLAKNPGAEGGTGWINNGSNPTGTWSTTVKRSGSRSKESHNTVGGNTGLLSLYAVGGNDGYGFLAEPGKQYSVSLYFRSDVPHNARLQCSFRTQPGSAWIWGSESGYVDGAVGKWTRATHGCETSPTGTDRLRILTFVNALSAQPANTSAWVDDLMVTEGTSFPEYSDGSSPNWVWNGAPNNSTSTGPAL